MKQFFVMALLALPSLTIAVEVVDPTQPRHIYVASDEEVVDEDMVDQVDLIRLQGVMVRKGKRTAIISGELYNRGDKVEGYLVREIHKNHVLLVGSGTQKRLYVYE